MCVVSMVMDHYGDRWAWQDRTSITSAEVTEFRQLLERAREYDAKHNEPDCGLLEKQARLIGLAKELGIGTAVAEAIGAAKGTP